MRPFAISHWLFAIGHLPRSPLGRQWDGCKSENRPCLPALGRWDCCTPPSHPVPPSPVTASNHLHLSTPIYTEHGLAFGDNLRARTLDDGKQFFLFQVRNFELVQRSLQVPYSRIELRVGNMHGGMDNLDLPARVVGRATCCQRKELRQVLREQRNMLRGSLPGFRLPAMN